MTAWRSAKISKAGKVVSSEHDIQAAFMEWCEKMAPRYPALTWFYANINGAKLPFTKDDEGRRRCRQARILKAEGLKSGVLDTFLPVARGGHHGLYIEFKSETGAPTDDQLAFMAFARAQGYCCIISKDHTHAAKVTLDYLHGRIQRDQGAGPELARPAPIRKGK